MSNEQMPWKIGAMESGRVAIDDAQDRQVSGWLEPEDAERILKAVNAHDELLKALEAMVFGAGAVAVHHEGERKALQMAVDIALAAIAKARGEA